MFAVLCHQTSNVLIYLKTTAVKNPACLPFIFALEYKASFKFQHLLDVEAKPLKYKDRLNSVVGHEGDRECR